MIHCYHDAFPFPVGHRTAGYLRKKTVQEKEQRQSNHQLKQWRWVASNPKADLAKASDPEANLAEAVERTLQMS
ncbi:hypothetical protein SLEP1_g43024 [Rubroshorea leprosula]|uniref:Uncharacterized protein n=1 Tax=Rubroshorea leprosula TaxID=152421 RepID=A0AAV5LBY0_9ROSI|nr:hypothetical protein SLEP1_g43024 [Rubroshorea leprosula]